MPRRSERIVTMRRRAGRAGRAIARLCILASVALPAWPQNKPDDLAARSIEDLMNIQVTSVSKTEQKLSRTASAIFVITQEEIRRSGATNIPDVLRMVPGLDVAQIDANAWAISARGFNGRFSNKLLVMVDGRSVYTPTFGGVFWDALDLPLEDIERIEVIRGPGGSIWGANAVNGVISIITKKAADTRGAMMVAGGGTPGRGFGTLQYGGGLGKSTDYRAFAKYFNQDDWPGVTGEKDGGDGWHMLRGGFRTDSRLSAKDTLMFQGDLYSAREGNPTAVPSTTAPSQQNIEILANVSGGFVQGVWNHTYSPRADTALQISYDRYQRSDFLGDRRGTLGLDFQHHFGWGARQNIVGGFTYRYSASHARGSSTVSLIPAGRNTQFFSSFIQDEIAIAPDRLYLTLGTKLELNYYTGWDVMPSVRLAWLPSPRHTIWAAVSRSLREPTALDTDLRANLGAFPGPDGIPVLVTVLGNPYAEDETLMAYEMGYRATVRKQLSIDFAAYYNTYGYMATTEPSAPFFEDAPPPPHLVFPLVSENLMHGGAHGLEFAANWKVTDRWTLSPAYAFERIHMHLDPASQDTASLSRAQGSSPVHSAQFRSHVALPHGLSWDTAVTFTDRLADPSVPSYTRADTGLSWQLSEKACLSVAGQNLLRDQHIEFVDYTGSARTTRIKRGAYAKLTWRF